MAIKYWVGAKAIVYNTKLKRLLVMKRSYDDTSAGFWENPGGKKEVGETIEETLKREILEETGIEVNYYKLLYATAINEERNPFMIMGFFITTDKEDIQLSFEHIEYKWATIDEYLSLVDKGIQHDFKNAHVEELIKSLEEE